MGTSGTSGVSASGVLRNYTVVVATSAGVLSSVTSATSPTGASLIGAAGWTFTVTSGTQLTIIHPLGDVWVGANSSGVNGTTVTTRSVSGNLATNYTMQQNSTYTTISFLSCTPTNCGFAGTGTATLSLFIFSKV
jgi:hypothetical protein